VVWILANLSESNFLSNYFRRSGEMERRKVTIDGNEAAAYVAYKTNEVVAIYPITPSSPMGEWCDAWSSEGKKNIWGVVTNGSINYNFHCIPGFIINDSQHVQNCR
jgi:hypothetical protein